jgi:hypothetical protein
MISFFRANHSNPIVNSVQPLIPLILSYETPDREVTVQLQNANGAAPLLPPANAVVAAPQPQVPAAPPALVAIAPPTAPAQHPVSQTNASATSSASTAQTRKWSKTGNVRACLPLAGVEAFLAFRLPQVCCHSRNSVAQSSFRITVSRALGAGL